MVVVVGLPAALETAPMAYPTPYVVTYDYTGFAQGLGDGSFPGSQIDTDLADIAASTVAILDFLEGITRSDGALKNGIVTAEALDGILAAALGDLPSLATFQASVDQVAADTLTVAADKAIVIADMGTVAADKAIVAADKAIVIADMGTVAADKATVAADKAIVIADMGTVAADKAAVIADKLTILGWKDLVAADKVTVAADKAIVAADKATVAADKALALGYKNDAAASASAASASFDSFDDRYLGPKASDPTLDNDGNALVVGALYFNTTTGLRIWNGATWSAYSAVSGDMLNSDNLSGLVNKATSRTNLGVAIGTNVQAWAAKLDALAALTWAADKLMYFTSASAVATADLTAVARTLLAQTTQALMRTTGLGSTTVGDAVFIAANAAAARTAIGAVIGTDVQAYDAQLSSLIRQNSQSGVAYTLVLTDGGKHILHPSADTSARVFTIPANASVAFPIGTAVTFVNQNAAGILTISITTDTMRLAGAGTTGSRTLAANGIATAVKVTATEWIISGTGLT